MLAAGVLTGGVLRLGHVDEIVERPAALVEASDGEVSAAFSTGVPRREIREAAGLPPIRLHDLQHGAASLMLAGGVDMKTVQETLGHSSITLTSDTYASVYPEASKDAAEKAAAMVPRRKGA